MSRFLPIVWSAGGQANVIKILIPLAWYERQASPTWHQKFFFGLVAKRPLSKMAILNRGLGNNIKPTLRDARFLFHFLGRRGPFRVTPQKIP